MGAELLENLLTPAILFFFLGAFAALVRSDLDIPQPLPKLFSLYLLLAIGFTGGVELRHSGVTRDVLVTLIVAVGASALAPLVYFSALRRRLGAANAAAVAATYGSVSAVTFLTAVSFLRASGRPFSGYMVAALALMESPAVVVGVALARRAGVGVEERVSGWGAVFREAFLNGSVLILLGSLAIGVVSGPAGEASLRVFVTDVFKGVLCLFLLDMGLVAGRRVSDLRALGAFPVGFALGAPILHAAVGIVAARAIGLGPGDALLMAVLFASASYIAVPAAIRHAIPEANPGLYVTMSLAVTFPFNIALGIPAYAAVIGWIWR